jgi:hypothetical protein
MRPDPPDDEAEKAVEEFARLLFDGEAPDPEAFLASRPRVADQIRDRILQLREARGAIGEFVDSAGGAPPPAIAPGRMLGDFRIQREIGRGGMGVVYLAEQISLRRLVALKVLPAHLTLQEDAVERFRREASTAARLKHPGIVAIHAVGEESGHHFFAMDFVEGTPLDRILDRMREEDPGRPHGEKIGAAESSSAASKKSYIETVCRLAAQVADALEHAHRAGVTHRDVKPSNVLVRDDGSPVLTDFGLAREEGLPSLTRTGEFAGTPYYVSPEQALARRMKVDHRTDVYSLGVMLFELLTLRRPFEGRTSQEVIGKIVTKEPPSPRKFNPNLSRDLETVVLAAIERDPERRYPTAAALAADLRAIVSFRPIARRRSSVGMRAVKLVRRHRAASAAAGSLLLSALAGGAWWWFQPGYLTITSPSEGATVFVDGERRGTAPLEVALSPGVHRVRLEMGEDLVTPEDAEVVIRRVARRQVERTLSSRNGLLHLESDPSGARVTLFAEDGREIGVLQPTPTLLDVRAGRFRARFELPGFDAREAPVEVLPGGARTSCRVAWETGALAFESFQHGAQVEIYEGDRIGSNPPSRTVTIPIEGDLRLPAATYSLRARLRDHDRRDVEGTEAVRVEAGETTRVPLWLRPIERRLESRGIEAIRSIVLADLDGDGLPAVVATKASLEVVVLGWDGTPRSARKVPALKWPIDAGDIDGDGRDEVFVGDGGRILALSPEGSPVWKSEDVGSIEALRATDLVGDARLEVLVGTEGGWIRGLSHDGPALFERVAKGRVSAIAAADLTGDGESEVVVGTEGGQILVLSPDGETLFERVGTSSILGVTVADLDGDERPEVVLGTFAGEILARTADGASRILATTDASVRCLDTGDIDGDGRPELVAGTAAGRILCLDSGGSLRFETDTRGAVTTLAIGDTDGDGLPEIYAGTLAGQFLSLAPDRSLLFEAYVGAPVSQLIGRDLDGDGKPELVAGGRGEGRVSWFESDGSPRLSSPTKGGVQALLAVDLDSDGRSEAVAGTKEGQVVAFAPDGSCRFEAEPGGNIWCLEAADLDGDGRPEILLGTREGRILALAEDGSRPFEQRGEGNVFDILAVDLDRDGRPEVVAGTGGNQVLAFHADGSRRFEAAVRRWGFCLDAADLDGDGVPEVLAGTQGGIVLLSADGSMRSGISATGRVNALAVTDLEEDGLPEIVAGSWGRVSVFSSDGTLRFETRLREDVWSVLAADLDGDRRKEVLASSWAGDVVAVASDGSRTFRAHRPTEIRGLAAVDLTGDGKLEVVVGGGNLLAAYSLDRPDPRIDLRRAFLDALDAAERGEEEPASRGFERARFRWLGFDDSRLGAIRARLASCRRSPSARRMAETLERIRPATALDWIEAVEDLVERNAIAEALALARERFADMRRDDALARALNEIAWSWVDPGRPLHDVREVALVLAEAAVAASGREDHAILDTLAEALHASGRSPEAAQVEEEALRKCPAGDRNRPGYEASLDRFRQAATTRR